MSNLHLQPAPRPIQAGGGPYGAPSAAAQFSRMAPHELAYQELQAHPPPPPQPFSPPLDEHEQEQAAQMYLDRIMEYIKEVWDQTYAQSMGHVSEAQLQAIFDSHEPLHVAPEVAAQQGLQAIAQGIITPEEGAAIQRVQMMEMQAGFPPSTLWLAFLSALCGYQTHILLQKYTKARERVA